MMRIRFTPKDILHKDFRQRLRGYDPTQVDSFLDSVIRDYQNFSKEIATLQRKNNSLRYRLSNTQSNNNSDNTNKTVHMDNATYASILKRLSTLEKQIG